MRKTLLWIGTGLVVVAMGPLAASAAGKGSPPRPLGPSAVVSAGNEFYRVFIENAAGSDALGEYTATTGPNHPAGPNLNVLFGDGDPGTTFNTVRSFTTNTDYVQETGSTSSNPIVLLSPFGVVTNIGTTGFRTTYTLPGPPSTPDALTIVQDLNVNGTTFANSTVAVTTTVTNNGASSVAIGIRYLWDFQIGKDDGPTFLQLNPFGTVLVDEAEFLLPSFESYRIQDNDVNPHPPTFDVFGTVNGPATVTPPPTAPGLLKFAWWETSVDTAFDYTVTPGLNIADVADGRNDSAVLCYFGRNANDAIHIAAGGSATVSASLFLTLPAEKASPVPAMAVPALVGLGLALAVGGGLVVGRLRRRAPA